MNPYYSKDELHEIGFLTVDPTAKVSRLVNFYAFTGYIGAHSRIDDFCVLKGRIYIGDYVHICSFAHISAVKARVFIESFVGLSTHFSCFSSSDDYKADSLNNPTLPEHELKLITGEVNIRQAAVIGAHCLVLPNVTVGEAASVGAHCIIHQDVPPGGIVRSPHSRLSSRKRDVRRILQQATRILGQ